MKLRKRALDPEFLKEFKDGGKYAEIVNIVRDDNNLILCLRGDYVCIYYKSRRILKIKQTKREGTPPYEFDKKYSEDCDKPLNPNDDIWIGNWVEYFKDAKVCIDNYKKKGEQLEKAVQQALVTENNYSALCSQTDYFMIDIEYGQNGSGRFDALAVHWPQNKHRNPEGLQIAFIEIKAGTDAVANDSGVADHYESSVRFLNDLEENKLQDTFCRDLEEMIKQLKELGLWKVDFPTPTLSLTKPELIYVMIDYNPRSTQLRKEIEKINKSDSKCKIPFKTLFATSSLMGYGLYDGFMIPMSKVLKYFEKKTLKVCIKRGAKEIGGSAVELTNSAGERLVIDLGLPLDAEENTEDLLPKIKGLKKKTDDLLGILISHPHQDHYGLGNHIDKTIPIYMSKQTSDIMQVCVDNHIRGAFTFDNQHIIEKDRPFSIGSFKITPYMVDHSACGSYAFLIESDGKRLFYSGDFRAHGRKSKLFEDFVKNAPRDIDLLLMEGSCLGRDQSKKYPTEKSLQDKFTKEFKQTKGVCFVQTSSQNIDRLETIYNSCKESGRILVMSSYTGRITMVINDNHLPSFIKMDVKKFEQNTNKHHHVTKEMIEKNPDKYVILLCGKIFSKLKDSSLFNKDAIFIYSMWKGYKELYNNYIELAKEKDMKMVDIHTSGHADIPTLQRFAKAIHADTLVPIHTFFPEKFKNLFDNVERHNDNETFEI
ncbi:MAG: hypothetical protein K6E29_07005 [Cyanobacteria bacterium RUI128]|nr:hypothetical protein [Cyanobacteria bacterium RUI128]